MQTSNHQVRKSFIRGDARAPIRFLRKIHHWIVVTYSVNGWNSFDCGQMTNLWSWFACLMTVHSWISFLMKIYVGSCLCHRSTVRSSKIRSKWRIEGSMCAKLGRPYIGKAHMGGLIWESNKESRGTHEFFEDPPGPMDHVTVRLHVGGRMAHIGTCLCYFLCYWSM